MAKKNIVVFTRKLGGHHLEYIHHVYEMAIGDDSSNYIFVIPISFNMIKDKLEWKSANHISFDLFDDRDRFRDRNLLRLSFKTCKLVASFAKKYNADFIYTNEIIGFVPFAPLIINKKHKLMGVIYRIYLHDIGIRSKWAILQDRVKYLIMSKFSLFYRVMILNDKDSADKLNKIYRTNKFISIPDPYVPIPVGNFENIRKEYDIAEDNILFAHFGAMNDNKGTIELLESLTELPIDEVQKYTFFLAGKVEESIRDRFYKLVEDLKGKVQLIVKDEYCSYEFFGSLCIACDAIVIPYKRTAQSSGLIGYASQFEKPVIAPNKGLLGAIVKKYELGLLINDIRPENLVEAYRNVAAGDVKAPSSKYCEENSIGAFQQVIFNSIDG